MWSGLSLHGGHIRGSLPVAHYEPDVWLDALCVPFRMAIVTEDVWSWKLAPLRRCAGGSFESFLVCPNQRPDEAPNEPWSDRSICRGHSVGRSEQPEVCGHFVGFADSSFLVRAKLGCSGNGVVSERNWCTALSCSGVSVRSASCSWFM